jgi:hypothetical protein
MEDYWNQINSLQRRETNNHIYNNIANPSPSGPIRQTTHLANEFVYSPYQRASISQMNATKGIPIEFPVKYRLSPMKWLIYSELNYHINYRW